MSNRGRWTEPTDREARTEYRALRKELRTSRTSKARAAEIENRLDQIAGKTDPKEKTPAPKVSTPTPRISIPVPAAVMPSQDELAEVEKLDSTAVSREWQKIISRPWPEAGYEQLAARCELLAWRREVLAGKTSLSYREWKGARDQAARKYAGLTLWEIAEQSGLLKGETERAEPVSRSEASFLEIKQPLPAVTPARRGTPAESIGRADVAKNPIERAALDLSARAEAVVTTDAWLTNLATQARCAKKLSRRLGNNS